MVSEIVNPITWLARLRYSEAADAPSYYIRARTDGRVPGPETIVDSIEDPVRSKSGGLLRAVEHAYEVRSDRLAGFLETARFDVPIVPTKVIGIGRNFLAHAQELGNDVPTRPLLFFKPPSCLLASGQALDLPRDLGRVDLEGEIVVVIGQRARRVEKAHALEYVGGYALGNDISARELQKSEAQWVRAKGMDGFGPISPWIRLSAPGFALPTDSTHIVSHLDETRVQYGRLDAMIFDIASLVSYISQEITLEVGDLIYTGTPAGVTAIAPGQTVKISSEGFALAPVETLIR